MDKPDSNHVEDVEAGFNAVASGYDRPALRGFTAGARRLVELAQLRPGQTILDIGTGTGNAAIAAAEIVG